MTAIEKLLLGIISTVALARLLQPEDFGLVVRGGACRISCAAFHNDCYLHRAVALSD